MGDYEVDEDSSKKPNKGLALAIVAAGLLIGLGLAFGIGFGLRSLKDDPSVVVITTTSPATTPPQDEGPKSRTAMYRFAAVTSDAKVCSEIGTRILAVGGSVVDSAIATVVCMGILNPSNGGIGGGFFMTYYDRATKTADTLDAREVAPLAANESLYKGRESASLTGGLAIGVPGQVAGLWAAHQKYGKLPFKDLLQPTIDLCRDGVKIASPLAYAIKRTEEVLKQNSFGFYFDPESQKPYGVGQVVKYPKMADTLEKIANNGSYVFYEGELSDIIVQEIQENGGIITKEDLKAYSPIWQDPTTFTLRDGHKLYSMPPPGSGPVLAYMLNIIDGYNFTEDSVSSDEKSILTFHRVVEAMKFAFAKRTELGDDEFEDVLDVVQNMTSVEFGDYIRSRINDSYTMDVEYYNPSYYTRPDAGTSQISIMDALGNAVSITSSINYYFGAKVRGPTTGIMYNNEMDDFSSPGVVNVYGVSASPKNFIKPGKRPMSSMCPAVIVDASGDVVLVIGGSGGTKITTGTFLVTLHALKFGRGAGEAVDFKRLHHQLLPNYIQVQKDFPKAIADGLKAKGHNFTDYNLAGNINIVFVKDGMRNAVCDAPKDGTPDGY